MLGSALEKPRKGEHPEHRECDGEFRGCTQHEPEPRTHARAPCCVQVAPDGQFAEDCAKERSDENPRETEEETNESADRCSDDSALACTEPLRA